MMSAYLFLFGPPMRAWKSFKSQSSDYMVELCVMFRCCTVGFYG